MNRDLLRRVAILGIVLAPMAVLLPACNKKGDDHAGQPADQSSTTTTTTPDGSSTTTTTPSGGTSGTGGSGGTSGNP